jgi:uncharacterized membrane protein YiaA
MGLTSGTNTSELQNVAENKCTAVLVNLEKVSSTWNIFKFQKLTEGTFIYLVGLFRNVRCLNSPTSVCMFSQFHVPYMKTVTDSSTALYQLQGI